jgi:hypothetical protein
MCDYSLHHVATRPAQIEDKLSSFQCVVTNEWCLLRCMSAGSGREA